MGGIKPLPKKQKRKKKKTRQKEIKYIAPCKRIEIDFFCFFMTLNDKRRVYFLNQNYI